MEIVKTPNLESLNQNIKDDFYIVPNLKFDIDKLRSDLNTILKNIYFQVIFSYAGILWKLSLRQCKF